MTDGIVDEDVALRFIQDSDDGFGDPAELITCLFKTGWSYRAH